jgi:hypothetical protein
MGAGCPGRHSSWDQDVSSAGRVSCRAIFFVGICQTQGTGTRRTRARKHKITNMVLLDLSRSSSVEIDSVRSSVVVPGISLSFQMEIGELRSSTTSDSDSKRCPRLAMLLSTISTNQNAMVLQTVDESGSRPCKKYSCDCERYCKRPKNVSHSTYVRHAPYRTRHNFSEELRRYVFNQNPNCVASASTASTASTSMATDLAARAFDKNPTEVIPYNVSNISFSK